MGIIQPIYKKKGSVNDPDNYRGISCTSKLFTALVNNRLSTFLEASPSGTLNEDQAGFRSGYSTLDHNFTLHSLIELYLTKKASVLLFYRL